MKLKYVTKPILITLLRYLDKNKILLPHRICYSSFRSKRDMLADFEKFYSLVDTPELYTFNLNPYYRYLVCPRTFHFCKKKFLFLDEDLNPYDLTKRPEIPKFQRSYGNFVLQFGI